MYESPYRQAPPPPPPDPWLVAWGDLERRRHTHLACVLAIGTLLVFAVTWIVLTNSRIPLGWWMGSSVLLGSLLRNAHCEKFPCPRCGHLFAKIGDHYMPNTQSCVHCGLEMGTPKAKVNSGVGPCKG